MTDTSREIDAAVDLQDAISLSLIHSFSLNAVLAESLAAAIVQKLREQRAGTRLYVPSARAQSHVLRAERNAAIRAAFTGNNYAALAEVHHLTCRQVRRIIDG